MRKSSYNENNLLDDIRFTKQQMWLHMYLTVLAIGAVTALFNIIYSEDMVNKQLYVFNSVYSL